MNLKSIIVGGIIAVFVLGFVAAKSVGTKSKVGYVNTNELWSLMPEKVKADEKLKSMETEMVTYLQQEKKSLQIVGDQWGTPTSIDLLANAVLRILNCLTSESNFKNFGTYHLSSQGETNWYEYACFVAIEAIQLGFKTQINSSKDIKRISSEKYASITRRPFNSRLNIKKIQDTFMLELPHWEDQVKKVLREKII